MCGILSISLYGKQAKKERAKRVSIAGFLFTEALRASKPRGKDATGVLSVFEDDWYVLKQPVDSEKFVIGHEQDGGGAGICDTASLSAMMKVWSTKSDKFRNALGHVRQGTQGSEYDHENNHPIVVQKDGSDRCVVGIHNGVITNDTSLFSKHNMDRIGKVDSEAIFQLLYKFAEEDGTLSTETLKKTYDELSGSFAFLATSMDEPEVIVGAVNAGRPCDVFFIPEIQASVLISEGKYLKEALNLYRRSEIRGEFDRTLTTEEYKKTLAKHVFSIDVRKSIKSAEEIFSTMEEVNDTSTTWTGNGYWKSTGNGAWLYEGYDDDKEKDTTTVSGGETSTCKSIIKYGGNMCELDEDGVNSMEGEDNFVPAPPLRTTEDDKDDTEANLPYVEVAVELEAPLVGGDTDDDDYEDFVMGMSYGSLESEGQDILENLMMNSTDGTYQDVVDKISFFSPKSTAQELMTTADEELVTETYQKAFGEGFAIGFRDGVVLTEERGDADEALVPESLGSYIKELKDKIGAMETKAHRQSDAILKLQSLAKVLLPKRKTGRVDLATLKKKLGKQADQVAIIGAVKLVKDIQKELDKKKEKAK